VDGVDAGTVTRILAIPTGIVLTLLYLRRWHRRRLREVRLLVSEGQAGWAAACRITHGAGLLADDPPAPRAEQASGTLFTARGRLEWRPDGWSLDAGWLPGSRPLGDVELLSTSWRRDIVGLRTRILQLEVQAGKVVVAVTAEAGTPPPQLAG
jgi:hypothetical protein